jgi:hypothetical protein
MPKKMISSPKRMITVSWSPFGFYGIVIMQDHTRPGATLFISVKVE